MRIDVSSVKGPVVERDDLTLKQIPVSLLRELGELVNTLSEDPKVYAEFKADPEKFLSTHPTLHVLPGMLDGKKINVVKDDPDSFNIVVPEKTRTASIQDDKEKAHYLTCMGFTIVGSCHLP